MSLKLREVYYLWLLCHRIRVYELKKKKKSNDLSYLWTSCLQMCRSEMQHSREPGTTSRLKGAFSMYKIPTGDWRNEHFHPLVPFLRKDYGSRCDASVFIRNSASPPFLPPWNDLSNLSFSKFKPDCDGRMDSDSSVCNFHLADII